MIEPDYYPLKQAAEILNCSKDTLINWGGDGKLPIYMLTRKYRIKVSVIDAKGVVTGPGTPSGRINRIAKVSCYSLQSLESGDSEATAYIDPEYFYDDMGKNLGGYRYEVNEASKVILGVDKIYPVHVLIKDCVLVIKADDLKRLQESEPKAETVECVVDVIQEYNWIDDKKLTKLKKQQQAILKVIEQKQFKPLEIPDGEKGTIELICKAEYSTLFDGESSFNNAWKKSRSLFCMANHASYAKRGKD